MHEHDFDKDIKAALDDIVDVAPRPPKWKWITSGYAPLRREKPRPWYRRGGAALLGAAAVTVLVVGVAAFIGSGLRGTDSHPLSTAPVAQTVEDLSGIWVLDNYTTDGETYPGESSAEGRPAPWIEFTAERVEGFSGCNDFASYQPPQITDGRLILGEVPMNAAGCLEPTPEPVIVEVIWSGPDGVAIEITATTMQLTTATSTLVFERSDRRPVSLRGDWSVQADDLACTDGVALDHRLLNPDATVTEMLTAVPSVVSVEEKGEFEYSVGYDAGGAAVATVIAGDIEPRQYHRTSCASLWGIRSQANLGGAVSTWVNDLGLSQASTDVWSERFVETCATSTGVLGSLAQRYVSEDADFSLWANGALPSAEQATATLETIWRTVCAASSFKEAPPMSTTGAQASCGAAQFDLAYTEGPRLTTDEFLATPQGQILDAFFVDGQGEPESDNYHASDGFSIVDENLILGYTGGSIISDFRLDGSDVGGWGGCNPRLKIDDLSAERWSVAGPIESDVTTIPILVQGGACAVADDTHIVTEIIEIEVQERVDSALITAWTRNIPPPSADGDHNYACAGVGIELDAEAILSQPLGDRTLLDAGMVPPGPVEIHG